MAPATSADLTLRMVPPESRTSSSIRRWACSLSLPATAWRTAARFSGRSPDQRPSSKAALAAATARSTSAARALATVAWAWPVEGSTVSKVSPAAVSSGWPLMNSGKSLGMSGPLEPRRALLEEGGDPFQVVAALAGRRLRPCLAGERLGEVHGQVLAQQ